MNLWLVGALGLLLFVALYFALALIYDLARARHYEPIELTGATISRLVAFTNLTPAELKRLPMAELELLSTAALLIQDVLAERTQE